MELQPLLIGAGLALAVGVFGTLVGLDRERAFYTTVTVVVASYYSLFAVLGGSTRALVVESLVAGAFVAAAAIGFRSSLWVVAIALGGHGVFDFAHGAVISNPGLPVYWPAFCAAYDVVAAAYLAWLLTSGRVRAAA
ncbi:MAG: hypothetical protein AB7O37_18975 [Vicinamibacteria bacterium]